MLKQVDNKNMNSYHLERNYFIYKENPNVCRINNFIEKKSQIYIKEDEVNDFVSKNKKNNHPSFITRASEREN